MKRFLSIILTVIMIATSVMCVSVFAADEIKVTINGNEKAFDVTPVIINDRTLVPMRGIFEELGATVEWDGVTQSVTASVAGSKIILQIGKVVAMVNGKYVPIDAPARLIEGRTMVPVRFIAETLGCEVGWEDVTRTVVIKGEVSAPSTPSGGDSTGGAASQGGAAVVGDGWDDLVVIGFEDGKATPSSGINFWGKDAAGTNVNGKSGYVSYADAGIPKPTSASEDFGSMLLKIDNSYGEKKELADGIVAGRINDIAADLVPFKAGEKYKVSVWVYHAAGKDKANVKLMVYKGKSTDGFKKNASADISKGEWKRLEIEAEATADMEGQTTGVRFAFSNAPETLYMDNVSFERVSTGGGTSTPAPSTPVVSAPVADAKLPSGGKVIVSNEEFLTMANGKTMVNKDGVLTVTVASKPEKDTGLVGYSKTKLNGMIKKDNVYMLTFKARLVSGSPYVKACIQASKEDGYTKAVFAATTYGKDWTTCYMPFVGASKDMVDLCFRFAGEAHVTEMKDFQLIDYGTSVKITDLPHTYIVVGNTSVNGLKLQ